MHSGNFWASCIGRRRFQRSIEHEMQASELWHSTGWAGENFSENWHH